MSTAVILYPDDINRHVDSRVGGIIVGSQELALTGEDFQQKRSKPYVKHGKIESPCNHQSLYLLSLYDDTFFKKEGQEKKVSVKLRLI
ncbi:hypothetical protein ACMAZH_08365 [Arenicellales bacterium nBUS_45]